jgi:predicted dehydrogenase
VSRPIRVGVVGCGLIAQSMHLRVLSDLPQFELVAVCDADPGVAETVSSRFGAGASFTAYEDLLALPEIDAVLVATPDHFPPALAALSRGRHLLVEKPLCWTPSQGAELVSAADEASVVALVGYMRRYDSAYEATLAQLRHLGGIRYGRIHDFACRFDKDRPLYDLAVPATTDGTPRQDFARHHAEIVAALGAERSAHLGSLYFMLLMFASHDLSMARGIFGSPEQVVDARLIDDASLVVQLAYRETGPCIFELSVGTRYEWFDEEVSLFGDEATLTVRLADPFVQYARSVATLRTREGDGYTDRAFTSGTTDAFRREWLHFERCIHQGEEPRTPLTDGLADLELAVEVIRSIPIDHLAVRT